ncbi:hypothetical protein MKW92_051579 [Papaver armeniacum]|nr:hypothetical protein MKW92_051579 [Papaver armeniacum]
MKSFGPEEETQLAIFFGFLLLARPPRTVNRPPTPMSNPNKHFEVPPGPPPPQDDGTR